MEGEKAGRIPQPPTCPDGRRGGGASCLNRREDHMCLRHPDQAMGDVPVIGEFFLNRNWEHTHDKMVAEMNTLIEIKKGNFVSGDFFFLFSEIFLL